MTREHNQRIDAAILKASLLVRTDTVANYSAFILDEFGPLMDELNETIMEDEDVGLVLSVLFLTSASVGTDPHRITEALRILLNNPHPDFTKVKP